jgi:hypothetical protein
VMDDDAEPEQLALQAVESLEIIEQARAGQLSAKRSKHRYRSAPVP